MVSVFLSLINMKLLNYASIQITRVYVHIYVRALFRKEGEGKERERKKITTTSMYVHKHACKHTQPTSGVKLGAIH